MADLFLIKMVMKLIMIIKNLFYILLGIYFILFPISHKVIIIRLPRDINTINIFVAIFFCIFFFLLTVKILYNLIVVEKKPNKVFIWFNSYITTPIYKVYWESLSFIDNYIKHELLGPKYVGEPLVIISKYINKYLYDRNSKRYVLIYFIIDILPKIVFILLFILDVFYSKKLCYIYKMGWIFLLPLLWRYIIFTFKEFSEYNIRGMHEEVLYFFTLKDEELSTNALIEECKDIHDVNTINEKGVPQRRVALRHEEATQEENDVVLDDYLQQFDTFMQIRMSVHVFETLRNKFLIFLFIYFR